MTRVIYHCWTDIGDFFFARDGETVRVNWSHNCDPAVWRQIGLTWGDFMLPGIYDIAAEILAACGREYYSDGEPLTDAYIDALSSEYGCYGVLDYCRGLIYSVKEHDYLL